MSDNFDDFFAELERDLGITPRDEELMSRQAQVDTCGSPNSGPSVMGTSNREDLRERANDALAELARRRELRDLDAAIEKADPDDWGDEEWTPDVDPGTGTGLATDCNPSAATSGVSAHRHRGSCPLGGHRFRDCATIV